MDSLSVHVLHRIKADTPNSRMDLRNQFIEAYLDSGTGRCWLADPAIAKIVQDSLLGFDGERYRLLAWVVMPNHVHLILEVHDGYPLSKLMFYLKGSTARETNRKLGRSGSFWQKEYFDRVIRDETHFRRAVEYIHFNPVKANLADLPEHWEFSSASHQEFTSRQMIVLAG